MVSAEGISVDPAKVETVMNWEAPRNVTEILSFLGLAGILSKIYPQFLTNCCANDMFNKKGCEVRVE